MNRLHAQWQRLFLTPGQPPHSGQAPALADAQGRTRALLLELARPAQWTALAEVWHSVQQDLALPAPAIAISGRDGYQLWFPLAAPIEAAQGLAFLQALCLRYLPDVPASRLHLQAGESCGRTDTGPRRAIALPPQAQAEPDRWSAFVSADLAPVFGDSPWIDMAPGPDAQADVLAAVEPIAQGALSDALLRLSPAPASDHSPAADGAGVWPSNGLPSTSEDPRASAIAFLMQVMRDDTAPLAQRVEAARALLESGR
ncbi:hypothetical protein H5407_04885 [Mitsuaria sp. WAJ17]|uniref:hypothetical protein n=1 Tax=Mitsuaria sp. WAJ17 TaxID=2761452 RepID=UPI0016007761|nr:hypothetical protein [Mitsuaria sp. WAJ17]MBB2484556.1 hypothetical protein [Mitsuaria sp. WAJ17]